MFKVFVLFITVFAFNTMPCMGQFDPDAHSVFEAKKEIEDGKFINIFVVEHSFDDQLFLKEIQNEYGLLTQLENTSSGNSVYKTSEITNKKWSDAQVFLIAEISNNNEIYPLGKNKLYYGGRFVDHPKYTSIFYLLNKNHIDILSSKKSHKNFKTYIHQLVEKLIKQ